MVGVPGRSKGCTTCRRRKKKCDLQYPWCNRCRNSGKACEGYARYPVFLNRTTQGLLKRGRLEEAKVPGEATGTGAEEPCRQVISRLSKDIAASVFSEYALQRDLVRRHDITVNSLPIPPSNAKVHEAQLVSMFWEHYTPSTSNAQAESPCAWLQQLIYLSDPPPALRLSLLAVAMTRLGWLYQDEASVRQGRVVYGHALVGLQRALHDGHSLYQDETLATCNVLALYELCESTSATIVGYNSHLEGLQNLLTIRGPDEYKHGSPFARAMLEETRMKIMFQSIRFRKASPLGSHEWSSFSWYKKRKDQGQKGISQTIYDHGYALAAFLEEIDNANLANENASAEIVQGYIRRCSAMDARLYLWYQQELVCGSEGPIYWLTPLSDSIDISPSYRHWASVSNNNRPFSFPNIKTASATTLYWAFKLIISGTIANICSTVLSAPATSPLIPLKSATQKILIEHGEMGRLENATNIMRSMPYCLHDSMGLLGVHRSLFALRIAIWSLGRSQMEELNLCTQMYRELYEKSGLEFAKQLADRGIGPKWGTNTTLSLSG